MKTSLPDHDAFLRIYLRDHSAGAAGGVRLAKRLAAEHEGSPLGDLAATLAREIGQDREVLEGLMARAGYAPNRLKQCLAVLAEQAGRLKLNGRLLRRSQLTPLVEVEALLAGIDLKRALWRSLAETQAMEPPTGGFEPLISRATDQRRRLAVEHGRAARRALPTRTSA